MGISHSTARWIAPLSFVIDFAAQQYGLLSSPNMMDVHNDNLSFWSPQPYFIGAFFFPQQLIQLAWLYRLYKLDGTKSATDMVETQTMVNYVPYYAIGNMCIAIWMIFWNSSALKTANIFVIANTLTQLYYLSVLQPPMNTRSTSSILTHLVSKTFAGIAVLDLLHNGSVAYFDHATDGPSTLIKVGTGVLFTCLASLSDWILGGCLVYDLVALTVGQSIYCKDKGWSTLLGGYAVGTAAIVGLRNWASSPYVKDRLDSEGYQAAAGDESEAVN